MGWQWRWIRFQHDDIDVMLAAIDPDEWHPEARREILMDYLGFPFWDVLTFPVMPWREVGELNEILIDRISPEDATRSPIQRRRRLKGFGFDILQRLFTSYRENDYPLGSIKHWIG